jgi:hypothetical protein
VDDLPQANAVLARIREILGTDGSVKMRDYGHGLGAVHVTLVHVLTPAAKIFSTSEEWDFVGSEVDTAGAPRLEFSRWVRLDGCTF